MTGRTFPQLSTSVLLLVAVSFAGCRGAPADQAADNRSEERQTGSEEPDRDTEPDIGTAVYVGDDMIRPYRPESNLVTGMTMIAAARYPAIDMHCHWTLEPEPSALIDAMDERNIRSAINLSGGDGGDLDAMMNRYTSVAPERLIVFCNLDYTKTGSEGFDAYVVDTLRSAHERGARGLKIFKNLGLTTRDHHGDLLAIDDVRLDIVWSTCAQLGMPVLIHSADPIAFFEPIDDRNERWMQLYRHPDWSFYGDDFPDREVVLAQRSAVMRRHPSTTFIGAHLGGFAEDLAAASAVLDKHSNFYMDISGRVAELGRQPYAARRFLIRHQDRILFGTDRYPGRPDQPRYRIYFRFLETDDEYFDYHDHPFPPTGEWKIYGVFLPDEALRLIYHDNAARLLGLSPLEPDSEG
ncbi:MAG: amidohydrolase family protein [Planctomycetota bacterium]